MSVYLTYSDPFLTNDGKQKRGKPSPSCNMVLETIGNQMFYIKLLCSLMPLMSVQKHTGVDISHNTELACSLLVDISHHQRDFCVDLNHSMQEQIVVLSAMTQLMADYFSTANFVRLLERLALSTLDPYFF